MELSEDGKTLICTDIDRKADGTLRKTVNLKKFIPADILEKFEDGKVYLYYADIYKTFYEMDYDFEEITNRSKENALAKKAANAYKKELLKNSKYTNVKVTHYRSFNENRANAWDDEKGKHSNNEAVEDHISGVYVVTYDELLSSTNGSGKIKAHVWDKNGNRHDYFPSGSGYYLADKKGKKIISIEFDSYSYKDDYESVTCSLDDVATWDHGENVIVLTAGETLSTKISLTGSDMINRLNYSKFGYSSGLLTIKKDGTVTAKKGKYGVARLRLDESTVFYYTVFVTDGSSKMLSALKRKATSSDGGYHCATLTIGKTGNTPSS